jgi:hypothetical protein
MKRDAFRSSLSFVAGALWALAIVWALKVMRPYL